MSVTRALIRGRDLIANVTPSESVLTDLDFPKEKLDQSMFPGIDSSIEVHTGFADAHARSVSTVVYAQDSLYSSFVDDRTAPQILSAVQTVLAEHNSQSVVITGHSLGLEFFKPKFLATRLNG